MSFNNIIPGSLLTLWAEQEKGETMAEAKFNKGDTVSIEAVVESYLPAWEELHLKVGGVDFELDAAKAIAKVTVTKKAVPPAPAGGTVIRYAGVTYTVDPKGNLRYIGNSGEAFAGYGHWDSLRHDLVKVL